MSKDSGVVVAFCGPDGTGKTTVATALTEALDAPVLHIHHRPELLPYPAPDPTRDFTQPHVGDRHTRLRSLLKVLYLYLDWLLAWPLRISPHKRRGGWVVIQRPWWDMLVDPRRYRLDIAPAVLRILGRLMPKPDLTVLLEGSPEVIRQRKPELSEDEIEYQAARWRKFIGFADGVVVDADQPVQSCVEAVGDALRRRASDDVPDVISIQQGRWVIPRKPVAAARTATRIYQPLDKRGRALRLLAQGVVVTGVSRLWPRAELPDSLVESVRPWLTEERTLAARRLRGGRWFVLVIESDGTARTALKVGLSAEARQSIEHEQSALDEVEPILDSAIAIPRSRRRSNGVLAMEPIGWKVRKKPFELPEQVALGLGLVFARTGNPNGPGLRGRVHGDLAPWNLLWDGTRWFLLDWEDSRPDGLPFYDVFHFYVQSHTVMGVPSARAIVEGVEGRGTVASAVEAFARGAGIDPSLSSEFFSDYLQLSADWLSPPADGDETAMARRRALHDRWRDRRGTSR